MEEQPERRGWLVRWSLSDPIGWLALQFAELFLAAALVRLYVQATGGTASAGSQWGLFAVLLFVLAGITYWVRRRYLDRHGADVDEADDDEEADDRRPAR